jgi:hypothetical protein
MLDDAFDAGLVETDESDGFYLLLSIFESKTD